MNREQKEIKKQYLEKIKNMSSQDKQNYDFLLELRKNFEILVKNLHHKLFPEEYDFINDSIADAQERKNNKNPMKQEYIDKMNKKRETMGFLPLSENGCAVDSQKTLEYCKRLIVEGEEIL